jgi:quaternary ammonium compound-resistance protein SugE
MHWFYLFIAAIFEIGWPLGFKLSSTTNHRIFWIIIAVISMGLSGVFLWLAQREIPIGTAYAVWTGMGAVGTLFIGIVFFGDSASTWRMVSALLIITGIVGLKLAG